MFSVYIHLTANLGATYVCPWMGKELFQKDYIIPSGMVYVEKWAIICEFHFKTVISQKLQSKDTPFWMQWA